MSLVQLAQAFPSTVGHCRSKESKAQVQEPQQIKVSKEVAHINASEVQARQPQSAEKPEAGQTSSEGVQSYKEIVRSTAKVPTSRNPHLFFTVEKTDHQSVVGTSCNLCMQL